MKFKTESEKETKIIAEKLAKKIKKNKSGATIITLSGDLGSGKTAFTKGFAQFFDVLDISSPTFVLMKKYSLKKKKFKNLYHIDCYRLENKSDLKELNFNKISKDKENIILIEWPERMKNIPVERIEIKFKAIGRRERVITILGDGIEKKV